MFSILALFVTHDTNRKSKNLATQTQIYIMVKSALLIHSTVKQSEK